MKAMPGWALAWSLLCVLSQGAVAAEGGLQEGDPEAENSVEAQEAVEKPDDELGFSVHGIGYLSFMAPMQGRPSVNLLLAQAELKYDAGPWGAYATPRFKEAPVGTDKAQAYLFLQQAYGFAKHPYGEVKLGKIYQRFGRLWDYGFYGPLLANDDVKLQPDLGIAAEGAPEVGQGLNLEYAAQYFPVDGRAFSVRNPKWFSGDNVRRRNIVVLRGAPTYHFDSASSLALGVSGSRFEVTSDGHPVLRGALDADFAHGPFNAFVEAGRQVGRDWASVSRTVPSHNYVWGGVSYKYAWLQLRGHVNGIWYDDGRTDLLLQPGAEVNFTDNFGAMLEGAWWTTNTAADLPYRERSLYVIAMAKF